MKKMNKNISLKEIKKKLKSVKHPVINSSLYDLGIIDGVKLNDNKITIFLAFPFPNIPIKDILIERVKEPLLDLKMEIEISISTMSREKLNNFSSLEQKNWQG